MKSNFSKNFKKSMSLFLSMLMILSCWVWVAPRAEAVEATTWAQVASGLSGGSTVVLTSDISADITSITVGDGAVLNLNGHNITYTGGDTQNGDHWSSRPSNVAGWIEKLDASTSEKQLFLVDKDVSFSITGSGTIKYSSDKKTTGSNGNDWYTIARIVKVNAGGTFSLYNAKLDTFSKEYATDGYVHCSGALAVPIHNNGGTVNIYSGTINATAAAQGNSYKGSVDGRPGMAYCDALAIPVYSASGTVNMYGGTITSDVETDNNNGSDSGGNYNDDYGSHFGYSVCVDLQGSGIFNMYGGSIQNNGSYLWNDKEDDGMHYSIAVGINYTGSNMPMLAGGKITASYKSGKTTMASNCTTGPTTMTKASIGRVSVSLAANGDFGGSVTYAGTTYTASTIRSDSNKVKTNPVTYNTFSESVDAPYIDYEEVTPVPDGHDSIGTDKKHLGYEYGVESDKWFVAATPYHGTAKTYYTYEYQRYNGGNGTAEYKNEYGKKTSVSYSYVSAKSPRRKTLNAFTTKNYSIGDYSDTYTYKKDGCNGAYVKATTNRAYGYTYTDYDTDPGYGSETNLDSSAVQIADTTLYPTSGSESSGSQKVMVWFRVFDRTGNLVKSDPYYAGTDLLTGVISEPTFTGATKDKITGSATKGSITYTSGALSMKTEFKAQLNNVSRAEEYDYKVSYYNFNNITGTFPIEELLSNSTAVGTSPGEDVMTCSAGKPDGDTTTVFVVNIKPNSFVDFVAEGNVKNDAFYGAPSGNSVAHIVKTDGTEGETNFTNLRTSEKVRYDELFGQELTKATVPYDKLSEHDMYLYKKGYEFRYFTYNANGSGDKYYIIHPENGQHDGAIIKNSETYVAENEVKFNGSMRFYGQWEAKKIHVTFINADGSYLYDNTTQPADHRVYFGNAKVPKYSSGYSLRFTFAGWINMNTGELVKTGIAKDGTTIDFSQLKDKTEEDLKNMDFEHFLPQYLYEDTTYMAYYTAETSDETKFTIKFDYKNNGIQTDESGNVIGTDLSDGDKIYTVTNAYYDKLYKTNGITVPYLQNEVFGANEWFEWIKNGLDVSDINIGTDTVKRGSVTYNENSFTIKADYSDCYVSTYTAAARVEPGQTYRMTFKTQDLDPSSHAGNITTQFYCFFWTDYETAKKQGWGYEGFIGDNAGRMKISEGVYKHTIEEGYGGLIQFTTTGVNTWEFKIPEGIHAIRMRFDNDTPKSTIKFSDITVARTDKFYSKASTTTVDYYDPVWIDKSTDLPLSRNDRITQKEQTYYVGFSEKDVEYSLTTIAGATANDVEKVTIGGKEYYRVKTNAGIKTTKDDYKWSDNIVLTNPGAYADGVYNYTFVGWYDPDTGVIHSASENSKTGDTVYALSKYTKDNIAVTTADKTDSGIYSDEYIRSDGDTFVDPVYGYTEAGKKNTKTYIALYSQSTKKYTVKFVNEAGADITDYVWDGIPYDTTIANFSVPADQVKTSDTSRYTYKFAGWDDTTTKVVERFTKADLTAKYATGVKADATYKPVFDETVYYAITFLNSDKTLVKTVWVKENEKINADDLPIAGTGEGQVKTPDPTESQTYEVTGWATEIGATLDINKSVTADATYVAQVEPTLRSYPVTFYNYDNTEIDTIDEVLYGSKAAIADVPQKESFGRPSTDYYDYKFIGWDNAATPGVIETLQADEDNNELENVTGAQQYIAVYKQVKRAYSVKFYVPDAYTCNEKTGENPASITVTTNKFYEWTVGTGATAITYGGKNELWPAYFFDERIKAPSVVPELAVTDINGYTALFKGWYTEPDGQGEKLSASSKIDSTEQAAYYAYFELSDDEYVVRFHKIHKYDGDVDTFYYESVGYNGVIDNATLETLKAELDYNYPQEDEKWAQYHKVFDGWEIVGNAVLGKDTDNKEIIKNITGSIDVYATYKDEKHDIENESVITIEPTYFEKGEKAFSCSCENCSYAETKEIPKLVDDTAPKGSITVKETISSEEAITLSTAYTDTTATAAKYVGVDSVDVMINTVDDETGINNLWYYKQKVTEENPILTAEQLNALKSKDALAANSNFVECNKRNDHFIINGDNGDAYIIYAVFCDSAKTATDEDAPNFTCISTQMIVFDTEAPEISVSKTDGGYVSAAGNEYCIGAKATISDTFLDQVVISIDGEDVATITEFTDGVYEYTPEADGAYKITATDKNGKKTVTEFTYKTAHTWRNGDPVVVEPACGVAGSKTWVCTVCGSEKEEPNGDALEHSFTVIDNVSAATCTENSTYKLKCDKCGEYELDDTTGEAKIYVRDDKLGHDYKKDETTGEDIPTEIIDATCVVDGKKIFKCTREGCDYEYEEVIHCPGSHDIEKTENHAATCIEYSYTVQYCKREGCVDTPIITYDTAAGYADHKITTVTKYEATCTTSGVESEKCSVCDYEKYIIIPAKGHTVYNDDKEPLKVVTVTEPTCISKGLAQYVCTVCGYVEKQVETDLPEGQDGHNYSDWIVDKQPTCTTAGSKHRICSYCGDMIIEQTKAFNHIDPATGESALEYVETVQATSSVGGYDKYVCYICGAVVKTNITKPLSDYKITVYDEDGIKEIGYVGSNSATPVIADQVNEFIPTGKDGKIFEKWVYTDDTDVVFPITLTADISIKAKYKSITFTINWVNGESTVDTTNVEYNKAIAPTTKEVKKATDNYYAYTPIGWTETVGGLLLDKAEYDTAVKNDTIAIYMADNAIVDFTEDKVKALSDKTYYAVFATEGVEYTITWHDISGNLITTTSCAYNTMPVFPEANKKDIKNVEEANYTKIWNGEWYPQLRTVTGDATYTAQYNLELKYVNIYYFRDAADTSDITKAYATDKLPAGETFVLPTTGPAKNATNQYIYSFKEWTGVEGQTDITAPESGKALTMASDGYKYVASYIESPINYKVKFLNEDEDVINTKVDYFYDDVIEVPDDLAKAVPDVDAGKYVYKFKGWKYKGETYVKGAENFPKVSGDMTFTPVFEQVWNTFTVTFYDYDGTTELKKLEDVVYGTEIAYTGKTPTRSKDGEYIYKWEGWNSNKDADKADGLGKVIYENAGYIPGEGGAKGEFKFYAIYSKELRTYDITWVVNDDEIKRTFNSGDEVVYPSDDAKAPSYDDYKTAYKTYTFQGWSLSADSKDCAVKKGDKFPNASESVTYYAVFADTINKYKIKWVNADEKSTELCNAEVEYGKKPVYTGATPTLASTDINVYTNKFVGWKDQNGKTYAADVITFGKITGEMIYTAQYETDVAKYEIEFTDELGVTIDKQQYVYDATVEVPTALDGFSDSINAYDFLGWVNSTALEGDAKYVVYTDKNNAPVVDFTTTTVTKNAKYAPAFLQTEIKYYNVNFDKQNGEDIFVIKNIKTNSVISTDDIPTGFTSKETDGLGGANYTYEFIGWATTKTGKDEAGKSTIVEKFPLVTADVTYYAIYEQVYKEYTVKFFDEESIIITEAKYRYNASAVIPEVLGYETRQKTYTFVGWKTDKNATDFEFAKGAEITVTGNLKLYPVFTATIKNYTVTFDYNNGTEPTSKDYTYGTHVVVPVDVKNYEDDYNKYTFSGWSPIPTTYEDPEGDFIVVTGDKTYVAQYSAVAKHYKVAFFDLLKTAGSELDKNTIDSKYISYKDDYSFKSTIVLPEAPESYETNINTYTFAGWALASDTDCKIIDFNKDDNNLVKGHTAFKAVYTVTEKTYTVTFNDYEGKLIEGFQFEGKYGMAINVPTNTDRESDAVYSYTFTGWSDGVNVIKSADIPKTLTKNVTYTATYESNYQKYTVTFLKEDGTVLKKITDKKYGDSIVVPSAPEKVVTGSTYVFDGWQDTAEGGKLYQADYIPVVSQNVTYKAHYTGGKNSYVLKFYINGQIIEHEYEYNDAINANDELSDVVVDISSDSTTYTFQGWAIEEKGKVVYKDLAAIIASEDYAHVTKPGTFFAIYEESDRVYNVKFFDEDGKQIETSKVGYKYNETLQVPADRTKTGVDKEYTWKFLGWSTQQGNAAYVTTLNNSVVKADANYYAVFEQQFIPYTVVFYNGNSVYRKYDKVNYNTVVSTTGEPSKVDYKYVGDGTGGDNNTINVNYTTTYTFIGWALTADGKVKYEHSADVPNVTDNAVYYAVFKEETKEDKIKVTVTFVTPVKDIEETYELGDKITVPDNDSLNRGYDDVYHYNFKGWSLNDDGSGDIIQSSEITVATETVIYYATYDVGAHNMQPSSDPNETYVCSNGGGSKETSHCTGCARTTYTEGESKHAPSVVNVAKATLRNNGTTYYKCDNCGARWTETIPNTGKEVKVKVVDDAGNPVANATVTVYDTNSETGLVEAIDMGVTNADGIASVYVPKDKNGTYNIITKADGYGEITGTITVSGDKATNNSAPMVKNTCNCTCHKDTFWAKIYRTLYKLLNSMFKVKCCNDMVS